MLLSYTGFMSDQLLPAKDLTDQQWSFCYHLIRDSDPIRALDRAYPKGAHKPLRDKYYRIRELRENPKVSSELQRVRMELRTSQRASLEQHLEELSMLRDKAVSKDQMTAAVRAEQLRGQALGFYVQRVEVEHKGTPNEIIGRLRQLFLDNPKVVQFLPKDRVRQIASHGSD
tara:strand:+ start:149 stop:664 length:516 start_codon:yes stop_codon:yes gene_type:complete